MKKLVLILVLTLLPFSLFAARKWHEITIPDTHCGDGAAYKVYLSYGHYQKLAVEFMGGGLCWDQKSCKNKDYIKMFNPTMPNIVSRIGSEKEKRTPLTEHTMIYLPYCTGDVYIGRHDASYGFHHQGFYNIQKTFNYLSDAEYLDYSQIKDLFVLGWSAGAIGAGVHTKTLDNLIPNATKKTLVMDSPGLHWGPDMWKKLSSSMHLDLAKAFNIVDMQFNKFDGNMAQDMDQFCQSLEDWQVGVMQSTKDFVMSKKYGEISAKDHKALIYSNKGLIDAFSKVNNCKAWIIDNSMHTFMAIPLVQQMSVNGTSAREFLFGIYNRIIDQSIVAKQ